MERAGKRCRKWSYLFKVNSRNVYRYKKNSVYSETCEKPIEKYILQYSLFSNKKGIKSSQKYLW